MLPKCNIFTSALIASAALAVTGCATTSSIPQQPTSYWAYELLVDAQDRSNRLISQDPATLGRDVTWRGDDLTKWLDAARARLGTNSYRFVQWAPSEAACQATRLDTVGSYAVLKGYPVTLSAVRIDTCRPIVVSKSTSSPPDLWAWTIFGWDGYGGAALTQDVCEVSRKAAAAFLMKSPCIPLTATWK